MQEEHSVLAREREALRRRTDALQMTLMQSQGQGAVGRESSPQAILQKVGQHAALLVQRQACWQPCFRPIGNAA